MNKLNSVFFVCFFFLWFGFIDSRSNLSIHPDNATKNWRPVVLMHGLLASAEAMSHAQKWIESDFPGIHVHNVEIGNGRDDSMFMPINQQVELLASSIRSDPLLSKGFNLIGHSQGGLLTRAYIERYNQPPVFNYISWAGPNAGVYGVPDLNAWCPDEYCPELDILMDLIMDGGWSDSWMQEHISFSTYWVDPFNYDLYLEKNTFLADINNDRASKNQTYKKNFSSLNKALLIYSSIDEIVVPKVSPWFSFFKIDSQSEIVPWNETVGYKEDFIGMKTLYEQGKLDIQHIRCLHQNIPRDVCKPWYDLYTRPLLNNTLP